MRYLELAFAETPKTVTVNHPREPLTRSSAMSVRRIRCSLAIQPGLRGHSAPNRPNEREAGAEGVADDVECPLPFSLQDLCLLVVISDLDSYPDELLASLPLWLRNRLINNLPVLDLCRIENTSVAKGVNLQQIWGSRCFKLESRLSQDFEVKVCQREDRPQRLYQLRFQMRRSQQPPLFKNELESAIEGFVGAHCRTSRENYISTIASDILSSSNNLDISSILKQAVHKLTSVQGKQLLFNLLDVSYSQSTSSQSWKKQATALVIDDATIVPTHGRLSSRRRLAVDREPKETEMLLTPERLQSTCKSLSTLELLSLLGDRCKLRPSSAWIHVEMLSSEVLQNLHSEKFALDNSLRCSMACTFVMNQIMSGLVILRLRCDLYSNIGVMISLLESVKSMGSDCQLRHVFCTLPDLFMDVVKPFLSLFSLSNFYQLNIEVENAYPLGHSKLIQGFLTTQCSKEHQLVIHTKGKLQSPFITFKLSQLAALNLGEATVPQCAVQHKILKFSSWLHFTHYLPLLLQMPTVRLNEIAVNNQYLHLCALHPDLQVAKLVIWLAGTCTTTSNLQLRSIYEDLVSLFKISSLQELSINIHNNWCCSDEVRVGLTEGLCRRSHCNPLRKISLNISSSGYNKERFQQLWDVIFSLPQLDQLEIVLGKEFTSLMRQFMDVICERWMHVASDKKKLKSIVLTSPYVIESDSKVVAQSYSYNK